MTPLQCIITGPWGLLTPFGQVPVDGPKPKEIVRPTSACEHGYTLLGYGAQKYIKKYFVPLIDDTDEFDFRRELTNEGSRQKEHHRVDA